MSQLIEFFLNHWILVNLFIILLGIIFVMETRGSSGHFALLSTHDLVNKLNRENATLLDLREKEQFLKGHIANAVPVKREKLANQTQYQKKPIILVCQTGQDSLVMQQQLKKQGFTSVMALKGGIKTWLDEGLPLVQKKAANQ